MTRVASLLLLLSACGGPKTTTGTEACPDLLACPAPVEAECSGAITTVEVADAAICDLAKYTDNRLNGYDVGETKISFEASLRHFSGTRAETCETGVTVVDTRPPIVSCESSVSLVRAAADEPMPSPPIGSATDACDGSVDVSVSPTTLIDSLTDVVTTGTDDAGNSATCTTSVEVLDVFAVPNFRLLGATLDGSGGTDVTLGWELPDGGAADQVALQRSTSTDGPWQTVSTHNVDDQLGTASQGEGYWYRVQSRAAGMEGGSTDAIYVHAVGTDQYDIASQTVATVPFPTTLYGVVRYPADLDAGPYPLVVIMHGNHGNCRQNGTLNDYCGPVTEHSCDYSGYSTTPNAEGLAYLAESLAARGMIATTVSANALNCRGGYIRERAQLLRSHLDRWNDWQGGASGPMGTKFAGKLDLSRVGLVGHSRGGDAVSWVPQTLADNPISGLDVASIFAIAPTDYNDATVFDSSWALLLAACDGDVSNLWGSDIYERSIGDVPHKSQVFFPGANHNFFSTEWAYDDGARACSSSALVGKRAQQTMLQTVVGSWMTRTLDEDQPSATQRAERPTHSALDLWAGRQVDLRWSYTQDGALLLDAFTGDAGTNEVGGANEYTGFDAWAQCSGGSCGGAFLHRTTAVSLEWQAGSSAIATFALNNLDTSAYDALSFRAVSQNDTLNSGRVEQDPIVRVKDRDGQVAEINVSDVVILPHLYSAGNIREVLQSVRIPFPMLLAANGSLNTAEIASISIEVSADGRSGGLTLTELELGY